MESKYIRADLLMNKIAGSAFFSAVEKGKICVVIEKEPGEDVTPVVHAHWDVIDGDSGGDETFLHVWETLRCSRCGMERTTEDGFMPLYFTRSGLSLHDTNAVRRTLIRIIRTVMEWRRCDGREVYNP